MLLTPFDNFAWAASFTGHLTLLALLFAKKRQKDFSVFTTLIFFNVIRTTILFLVSSRYSSSYFNIYWSLAAIDEALGFAIVHQGAAIVFRPAGTWARDVKTALWVTAVFSLLVAGLLTYLAAPSTVAPVQSLILKGKFMAASLMTELFVGMMALSARVGLPWRNRVMHICTGLGIYAAACVIIDTTITCYGIRAGSTLYQNLSHTRIIVYLSCLLYWIVMLYKEPAGNGSMPESMGRQLDALQKQLDADLHRIQDFRKV